MGLSAAAVIGIAAVVGSYARGDWIYLVVEQPAVPTTFKAVVGWRRRGAGDEVQPGGGCCPGTRGK